MAIDYSKHTWADGQAGGTPITAQKLNEMETGIKAAADGVDMLSGKIPTAIATDLNITEANKVTIQACGQDTLNTPYKQGITTTIAGFCLSYASSANFAVQLFLAVGGYRIYMRNKNNGTWNEWKYFTVT